MKLARSRPPIVLSPSDRVTLIGEIANRLKDREHSYIANIFRQISRKSDIEWEGLSPDRLFAPLQDLDNELLFSMAKTLGHDFRDPVSIKIPNYWQADCFRLFISHLAREKEEAKELKEWLELMDVSAFVAHEDIAPTNSWEHDLLAGLETCHAVVALLRPGFNVSEWTNQELGYAMGRGLLVISVRLGEDPRGFSGKFQALHWDGQRVRELAEKIVDILIEHEKTGPKVSEILVSNLEKADSWERSKTLGKKLAELTYWDDALSQRCQIALGWNPHVETAYNVSDQITSRIRAFKASKETYR